MSKLLIALVRGSRAARNSSVTGPANSSTSAAGEEHYLTRSGASWAAYSAPNIPSEIAGRGGGAPADENRA
jgi:hypothetical protein